MRTPVHVAAGLVVAAAVTRVGLDSHAWLEYDAGGKADDLAYYLVAVSPLVLGAVAARWWSVVFAGAVFALSVVVEHGMWHDDPRLSGMDDIEPLYGIWMVPLPMTLAALGLGVARVAERLRARRHCREMPA